MAVYIMRAYSLLYGLISVPQRLLQNSTVLCSFSRFDLLNEQAGEAGHVLSLVIINRTDFTLTYLSFNRTVM